MSIVQARRLSYTRRDISSIHADVDRYLREFISRIQDTSQANTGRLFLTINEALIDNLNFSVDQAHLESLLTEARQRKNIITISKQIGYNPKSTASSSADQTFNMLSGVAGAGGQPVPIFTRCQTTVAPIIEFLTIEAGTIPEGETTVVIPAVQGIRVVDEVLTSAADGTPNQEYIIANAQTPHSRIEVRVDSTLVDVAEDFADGNADEIIYTLSFDENDFSSVKFGDDEFGKAPPTGSAITVSYFQSVGESGNAGETNINRVIGSLASIVGTSNVEAASGGAASESDESVKRNAPANKRAATKIVTRLDHEVAANAIEGVFSSFAKHQEGARTNTYILPEGGGVASSALLSSVQEDFDKRKMDGAIPVAFSLDPASILVTVNIVAKTSRIPKTTIRQKVREETLESLDFTKLIPGRAFTLSDISGIYENIENGKLVDYADFVVLSRVPRVTKSNPASPDFFGRVKLSDTIGYDDYLVTALTTTTFAVSKNGAPQSTQGTVAVEFTTDDNEVTFTLGETGDVFVIGDTWSFSTSKFRDNIVIGDNEFMRLQLSTDLVVAVFFPGEYDLKTQSAA